MLGEYGPQKHLFKCRMADREAPMNLGVEPHCQLGDRCSVAAEQGGTNPGLVFRREVAPPVGNLDRGGLVKQREAQRCRGVDQQVVERLVGVWARNVSEAQIAKPEMCASERVIGCDLCEEINLGPRQYVVSRRVLLKVLGCRGASPVLEVLRHAAQLAMSLQVLERAGYEPRRAPGACAERIWRSASTWSGSANTTTGSRVESICGARVRYSAGLRRLVRSRHARSYRHVTRVGAERTGGP